MEPLGIVNCMVGKQDTNEINLSGTLHQGNDSLEVSVLLDTGAEKSFVNARLLRHFPHLDLSPTVLKINVKWRINPGNGQCPSRAGGFWEKDQS